MAGKKFYLIGSTHVDLGWKRGSRELAELFELFVVRLIDLLETVPSFTYVLEQMAHLRRLSRQRPDLLAKLRSYLQAGRLEVVGGMASTMETNAPNGESFVRNLLLGLGFAERELGVKVSTGWLIDTFGLNAQIPQLLRQTGVSRLLANRFGANKIHDVFRWQGLDGSEVLTAGRDVYCPYVRPGHVFFAYYEQREALDRLFQTVSAQAAGPGPFLVMPYTENETPPSRYPAEYLQHRREQARDEAWCFATPAVFFDALETTGQSFPRISEELNPEFTGTFSQRIAIRLRNREVENRLLEAEKWACLAGLREQAASLDEAWWHMAFAQFHDLLTGSHPTAVMNEVLESLQKAQAYADTTLGVSLPQLMPEGSAGKSDPEGVIIFNGLPWTRNELVWLSVPQSDVDGWLVKLGEREIPATISNGQIGFLGEVPSFGYQTYALERSDAVKFLQPEPCATMIENEHMEFSYETDSGICLRHKPSGRRLIDQAADLLVLQEDRGHFQIEDPRGSEVSAFAAEVQAEAYRLPGLYQQLRLKGVFPTLGWTRAEQALRWEAQFTLPAGSRRLDLVLRLSWHGESSRIRLKITTTLDSSAGIYEIPFGVLRRRPYRVRSTARGEWPAQRFAAVQDHSHGLALLNTGVHGVETAGGTLLSTLLRAPASEYAGMVPDETSSQHGEHVFRFALIPYQGGWEDAQVVREAMALNTSLILHRGPVPMGGWHRSWLRIEPENVIFSALKQAQDGSGELVLRVYEVTGRDTQASIWVEGTRKVWASDILERVAQPIPMEDGSFKLALKPHEIATVRILCK
jgi:alpha-mannosidase